MPLYEYACPKCQKEFELLIRGNERPICPHCGSKKVERQMSAPAGHVRSQSDSCGASVTNCGGSPCCMGCPRQ